MRIRVELSKKVSFYEKKGTHKMVDRQGRGNGVARSARG